jgi:hypothetical protein
MTIDRIWVSIGEMCITDTPLTIQEAQTLSEHSLYLSSVRTRLGRPVNISLKSGHRPASYERSKGRSGNSEHSTFNQRGRGAVDLVYYPELLEELLKDTFYTRICYYPNNGFIHCDRRPTEGGRQYFEANSPSGKWNFIRNI